MHSIENNILVREALNCIENLLIRDEIDINRYELLNGVIRLFDYENSLYLGEGIAIKLVDYKQMP